ncbi:MAG: hypothetical protein KJ822_05825, partial [Proteobacteria bacterium]|nr:hypothetical protein [Pseudomonadota bacterium]
MEKFCVFCGNKPDSKNMEHIIPKWLIELTGDLHRKISLGYDFNKDEPTIREFSFNSFRFPSCKACNSRFGNLEGLTKPIIIKMLGKNPISDIEINILLDWLDKIRIGLWLAFHYLDKNYFGIDPNYYISFRNAATDRMVAIYYTNKDMQRINFIGVNVPIFYYNPCCFTFCINNLILFNMSTQFLFARRIGFPFPESMFQMENGKMEVNIVRGLHRFILPLIKRPFIKPCSEFYQPMFGHQEYQPIRNIFYDNEFVRKYSMDWEKGIGKVFIQEDKSLSVYPNEEDCIWQPEEIYEREYLDHKLGIQTLEFQIYLSKLGPSIEKLPKEIKKEAKAQSSFSRNINKLLIK